MKCNFGGKRCGTSNILDVRRLKVNVFPDDGPVRTETCSSLTFLKILLQINENYVPLLVNII